MSLSKHVRSVSAVRSLVCVLTALAVATASCSGMHLVPAVPTSAEQPLVWQVKAGETIRVTLRSGGSALFQVQSVTPDAIIASDGTRFENANIKSVERGGISLGKTAGAVGAGLGTVAVVFVVTLGVLLSSIFGGGGTAPHQEVEE